MKRNDQNSPQRASCPPSGFAYIEDSIYRASAPVMKHNISFVDSLQLHSIVNVSGDALDPSLLFFTQECEVAVYDIVGDKASADAIVQTSEDCKRWVTQALELLLSLHPSPVLIIGHNGTALDALLIACLRKLQRWSFVSILTEFRSLAGVSIFDYEQFIEHVELSLTSPFTARTCLTAYSTAAALIEETQASFEKEIENKEEGASSGEENLETAKLKLEFLSLFSSISRPCQVVTGRVAFDPALR